jgi:hypothetical protein
VTAALGCQYVYLRFDRLLSCNHNIGLPNDVLHGFTK